MNAHQPLRVGIVVGEASGDQLAVGLMQHLRQHFSEITFEGVAGPQMIAAGCRSLFPMETLSLMGFVDVLKHLPSLLKGRRQLLQHFSKNPPDLFIGVDAPDFNLGVEARLKSQGIPTVHYVSPSVWAWRRYRIKKIAKAVDLMLTLLPFEADFYREHQINVAYVGHPLADRIPIDVDKAHAKALLNLSEHSRLVALLPGSRQTEIQMMGPIFLEAAKLLRVRYPDCFFVIPMINAVRAAQMQAMLHTVAPDFPVRIIENQTADVLAAADIACVASGTATLETMLFKTPMVVAYRVAPLNYWIAKRLIQVPFIALPNLMANELLFPELIQDAASPAALSEQLAYYFDHPEHHQKLVLACHHLHQRLRMQSDQKAAEAVAALLKDRMRA